MAVDKLVDSTQLDSDLTSVANAIRTKGGTSASLAFPSGFVSAINAISGGGGAEYLAATVTSASSSKSVSFPAGDFVVTNTKCLMIFVSDVTENDPSVERIRSGTYIRVPDNNIVKNGANSYSFISVLKAGSGTDYFTYLSAPSQSGTTITVSSSQKHFAAGGTYYFWIYNLENPVVPTT